jgi:hypothetical protein
MARDAGDPTLVYLVALLILAGLWLFYPHSAKHPAPHPLQRAVVGHLANGLER